MRDELSESMYDKLGDLLSETLDSGIVYSEPEPEPKQETESPPQREQKAQPEENIQGNAGESDSRKEQAAYAKSEPRKRRKKIRIDPSFFTTKKQVKNYEIFKFQKIPENVVQAFTFFKIPDSSSHDESKKAYREKLMYFHPDKWNDNPVLQKIAKEKTEQIIYFWRILDEWFKNKENC